MKDLKHKMIDNHIDRKEFCEEKRGISIYCSRYGDAKCLYTCSYAKKRGVKNEEKNNA